ncbi:MAG: DUF1385 domain-containing protein [bacterium]|nr:DUF1385 domain-containing protein [bacterium]
MNLFKKINFIALNWAIGALDKDVDDEKPVEGIDFAVGGQAVIEGVMMRSPNNITVAVRKPNGKIKVKKNHYQTITQRYKRLNVPIIRGVVNLFEMMIVGTKAINFSANESLDEAEDELKKESKPPSKIEKVLEVILFTISFILAMALSIFLFKALPLWITTYLESHSTYIAKNYIVFNLIDGLIKMSIFLSYIFILSLIPSFRRIFEYHGAEHKSIFNYENKIPLNVENASKQIRFHPRCGTSFILIVFTLSIIVYTFIPKQPDFINNLLVRLAALPLIAGISYEYLKLSARHMDNVFVKALVTPGLWFQRLTTKEPDEKQLAVGLKSLKDALAMEKG